jgi:hypothetical protein
MSSIAATAPAAGTAVMDVTTNALAETLVVAKSSPFEQLYEELREKDRVAQLGYDKTNLTRESIQLRDSIGSHVSSEAAAIKQLDAEIVEKEGRITALVAAVATLHSSRDAEALQFKVDTEAESVEHRGKVDDMLREVKLITEKYEEMTQYQDDKEGMQQQLREFMDGYEREKRERGINVNELERRNVMGKDRLKNEMLRKIRETKLSLLAMTEDQLHSTTKRTIMENEHITSELQFQSKASETISKQNLELRDENKRLKRQHKSVEAEKQRLATGTLYAGKLIAKLKVRVDQLEEQVDQGARPPRGASRHYGGSGRSSSASNASNASDSVRSELAPIVEAHTRRIAELERSIAAERDACDAAATQTNVVHTSLSRILCLQDETRKFLSMVLDDVDARIQSDTHTHDDDDDDDGGTAVGGVEDGDVGGGSSGSGGSDSSGGGATAQAQVTWSIDQPLPTSSSAGGKDWTAADTALVTRLLLSKLVDNMHLGEGDQDGGAMQSEHGKVI